MARSWREAHHAVRNSDAHHESLKGAADSTLAAGNAHSIALGINAPPTEIGPDPFGRDGLESFTSKAPDFLQSLPWIHLPASGARPFVLSFLWLESS